MMFLYISDKTTTNNKDTINPTVLPTASYAPPPRTALTKISALPMRMYHGHHSKEWHRDHLHLTHWWCLCC